MMLLIDGLYIYRSEFRELLNKDVDSVSSTPVFTEAHPRVITAGNLYTVDSSQLNSVSSYSPYVW